MEIPTLSVTETDWSSVLPTHQPAARSIEGSIDVSLFFGFFGDNS